MTNKDGEIISIEEDTEEKDLGILFQKKMKFNKHNSDI